MPNPTLHEAGNGFARNISYPVQSPTAVQNTVAQADSCAPDSTLGEKHKNKICDESNKASENLYFCQHLTGGAAHPGIIVETAGLANIKPPRPVHRPQMPVEMVTSGKISQIQLERIIYAGQAHNQFLPESNARAGISIGDGTGVGKTGTILGIILDNWFSGRKRTVWFSVKFDLIKAVKDEMARLGFRIPIQLINDYKPEEQITLSRGVVFCTYQSLIAKSKKGRRRIDQLTTWLGAEGLLIFDEGHRAKNFFAGEERRGGGTQTGAAVVEIQDPEKFSRLPSRLFVGDCGDRCQASRLYDAARTLGRRNCFRDFCRICSGNRRRRHRRDGNGLPRSESDRQIFLRQPFDGRGRKIGFGGRIPRSRASFNRTSTRDV